MCGIAGVYNLNIKNSPFKGEALERLVDELFLGIENRGRHASGVVTVTGSGEFDLEKADLTAEKFIAWRAPLPKKVRAAMLHTRYWTKGKPTNLDNNHPVLYGNAIITHNGHISNDDELFKKEELNRLAEVDSEIIAALFDKYGIEKAHLPLQKLDGNFAISAMDQRHPDTLVLAKGWSSPLYVYQTSDFLIWASQDNYIKDAVKKSIGEDVPTLDIKSATLGDILYIKNNKLEKLSFKPLSNYKKSRKVGYSSAWETDDNGYSWRSPGVQVRGFGNRGYTKYLNGQRIQMHYCEFCNKAKEEEEMEKIGNDWYCLICVEGDPEKDQKSKSLATIENPQVCDASANDPTEEFDDEEEEDDLNAEHLTICALVGEKFGLTAEFVDTFLFGIESVLDGEIENEFVVALYDRLDAEYTQLYEDLGINHQLELTK